MLKSFLLSGTALAVMSGAALAQSLGDLAAPPERVVVSATRTATPLDQVASVITVIDAAGIEARQQRSLPDVLREVPGLNVVQVGGEGGQASLFMRGANANHTKVLVDGIDVADPSNPSGAYDFGKFNSADIAKVEVLRGPQSGLYGSDAIGGVVNIITKSGDGPLSLTAEAEGGSFDTFNQSASISGSDDGFHYRATLAHLHAGATPVTPLDLLPPGQKRNDDYFDNVTASAKLGYDVTENFDLGFAGRTSNSLGRITGDAFDPATFASFPSPSQTRIDTLSYAARGTAHLVLGPVDQTLGLSYSSTVTSDMDPDNGSIPSSGDRIKLDWQGQARISDGELLVLGAETGRDAIYVPLSAGITTNAGFGELQSGVTDLFGSAVDFHNSMSVRYDDNSRFGAKTTWRIAPVFAFKDTGTRLHATYGTGFKAPSLEQLFLSFPAFFFFANPNLKPETSTGYDVGLDQDMGKVGGGITWFHNNIRNLIETDPVTFSTDVNIGRARTEGIEAYFAWQAFDTLKLRTDYTYTEAEDADVNLRLVRRPKNKFSADAQWQALGALNLDLSLLYVGSWIDGNRDFSVSRLHAHPYWTADLAASYDLTDTLALTARINNLLDKRYENPVGFQGPGIGFFGGIKASF